MEVGTSLRSVPPTPETRAEAQRFCARGERQAIEQRALNISSKELNAFAREVQA